VEARRAVAARCRAASRGSAACTSCG